MAGESDSQSQLSGAGIGGQDRRRILLLNSTIELLSPVVCDKLKSAKRFSVERRLWGKLQTFILNVEEIHWRFSMFVGQTRLVETLLLSLESMIHLKDGIAEVTIHPICLSGHTNRLGIRSFHISSPRDATWNTPARRV